MTPVGTIPDRRTAVWLVDAYNVLRVSLAAAAEPAADARDEKEMAWWGADRRQTLLELAQGFRESAAEICLVFDARHLKEPQEDGAEADGDRRLRVIFVPSADEWIVRDLRERAGHFERSVVVTADRRLADRARHRGAEIVGTGRFLALCRPPGPSDDGVG